MFCKRKTEASYRRISARQKFLAAVSVSTSAAVPPLSRANAWHIRRNACSSRNGGGRFAYAPKSGDPPGKQRLLIRATLLFRSSDPHKALRPVALADPVGVQAPHLLFHALPGFVQGPLSVLLVCVAAAAPDARLGPVRVLIPAPDHVDRLGWAGGPDHRLFRDLVCTGVIPKAGNGGQIVLRRLPGRLTGGKLYSMAPRSFRDLFSLSLRCPQVHNSVPPQCHRALLTHPLPARPACPACRPR